MEFGEIVQDFDAESGGETDKLGGFLLGYEVDLMVFQRVLSYPAGIQICSIVRPVLLRNLLERHDSSVMRQGVLRAEALRKENHSA